MKKITYLTFNVHKNILLLSIDPTHHQYFYPQGMSLKIPRRQMWELTQGMWISQQRGSERADIEDGLG